MKYRSRPYFLTLTAHISNPPPTRHIGYAYQNHVGRVSRGVSLVFELNYDTDAWQRQNVEATFLAVPKGTNPHVVPGEYRFDAHLSGLLKFRFQFAKEDQPRAKSDAIAIAIISGLRLHVRPRNRHPNDVHVRSLDVMPHSDRAALKEIQVDGREPMQQQHDHQTQATQCQCLGVYLYYHLVFQISPSGK